VDLSSELAAGIIGGFLGGALGVISTVVGSYYGPRKLEEWREQHRDAPQREMLEDLLEDSRYPDGRFLKTLTLLTGTTDAECRRLLIQIRARGILLNGEEGWVLIKNKPFNVQ
jgi:hypothetical protein